MIINPQKARFILSAGTIRELPPSPGREFGLLGRSNVGKSSFINHVCGNATLARTSKRPGTTICANLYGIVENLYWVDLPGYGFATTTRHEKERLSKLISDYGENRRGLAARHIGVAMDREAFAWLKSLQKPVLPVLTKIDKLSHRDQVEHRKAFIKEFGGFGEPVLYSVHQHAFRQQFWSRFDQWTEI
jgi:GTP-binding protein